MHRPIQRDLDRPPVALLYGAYITPPSSTNLGTKLSNNGSMSGTDRPAAPQCAMYKVPHDLGGGETMRGNVHAFIYFTQGSRVWTPFQGLGTLNFFLFYAPDLQLWQAPPKSVRELVTSRCLDSAQRGRRRENFFSF